MSSPIRELTHFWSADVGRKSYAPEELDHARSTVDKQLAGYRQLAGVLENERTEHKARSALADFEGPLFNNLILALDRYFVHRLRGVTGKDGTPLNEVELICESLMNDDGVFRGNTVVKYLPEKSVLKLEVGDRIRLNRGRLRTPSTAFFQELELKYL